AKQQHKQAIQERRLQSAATRAEKAREVEERKAARVAARKAAKEEQARKRAEQAAEKATQQASKLAEATKRRQEAAVRKKQSMVAKEAKESAAQSKKRRLVEEEVVAPRKRPCAKLPTHRDKQELMNHITSHHINNLENGIMNDDAPVFPHDAQSAIEVAVGRRARKPSQKVRDNQAAQEELQGPLQSEVLAVLQELKKRMMAMETKEELYRAKEEAYRARTIELEEVHKGEVKKLEDLVKTLQLDIASLKEASPYWGQSLDEQGLQGTMMTLDLKSLDTEVMVECNTTVKMRDRLEKALRSSRGLEQLEVRDFKMWHTSETVKVARFLVPKEESLIRQNAGEWMPAHLRGARLIGPKWYSLKVDWVEKSVAAEAGTSRMSADAGRLFGHENGVDVQQIRWLGTPKPQAQHASAIVRVATKEDAEKLLNARLEGRDVTFGGGSVTVFSVVNSLSNQD
ncbi:hypothetical protein B0A49_13258, partial [Cryomyces minteri]